MKRHHIMMLAGAGLLMMFIIGSSLYGSMRAEQLEEMAQGDGESPLNRAYAQSVGPADAKVTIVEFFDPGCETCRDFAPIVKEMVNEYPGQVRLVLRYAPLHQGADKMVAILEAARLQGKYWETLQVMFDRQPQWASHHHPQPEKIWAFLPSVDMDLTKLLEDMENPEVLEIIRQDTADAKSLGVHKTPEFFVNGKPLPSFGLQQLRTLVKSEVAANYP